MAAATLTATHTFTASTTDRRRCTCGQSRNVKAHGYTPTRGAGRAAAEKLTAAATRQEETAATVQAAEDAVAAVYARVLGKRTLTERAAEATASEDTARAANEPPSDRAALDTLLGRPTAKRSLEELTAAVTAPQMQRVPLGTVRERKAPQPAAKKTTREPAPQPTGQIGKGVVRFTLTTEDAGTIAYTSGSQINRDYAKAVAENRPAVLRTIKGHIIRQHQPTA
jgi:hypothetical protein